MEWCSLQVRWIRDKDGGERRYVPIGATEARCRGAPARPAAQLLLRRPSLRFVVVAVTQVAYEVEGWGVAELVVADERVVWHELPWPRAERPARAGTTPPEDPSQTPTHPGQGPGPSYHSRRQAEIEAS